MTPKTLLSIKTGLTKLYKLVKLIADFRTSQPAYMIVAILLQNAQSDSSNCVNHDHIKDVKELYDIKRLLQEFYSYEKNDPFYEFVYLEYQYIIDGNIMSEDESFSEDLATIF
jgi:hypothetical protein